MQAQATQTTTPTPETIWAILQENALGMKELRESQRETARQMEEYNRRIGHLDNLFGEFAEYMIAPKLREKFRELDLNFPKANPNSSVNDVDNNIFLEIEPSGENFIITPPEGNPKEW